MKRQAEILLAAVAALATAASPAAGEIISASFQRVESLALTAVGTKDWAVFGRGRGAQGSGTLAAADSKKGGAGISRAIQADGLTKDFGGDGIEDTEWTGASWAWEDGTNRTSVTHRNGERSDTGMRLTVGRGGWAAFEFAAPPAGKAHVAYLLPRRDGGSRLVAVQGAREKPIDAAAGKTIGLAVVRYDGAEPLTIVMRSTGGSATARGFAAALSDADPPAGKLPGVATYQDLAMRKAQSLGPIDYLKVARDFADCMIRFGRDRYGKVHSPLFSNILTREKEPRQTPYPLFAELSPQAQTRNEKARQDKQAKGEHVTPFLRFDFNKVLNYPPGLGGEGPHKVTLHGCDPYEDQDLYDTLFELTRITGDGHYKAEADKALEWWFRNTQGPAGLYPWGEHLGWDFQHECPTYFDGPSKHLYAACYHEVKDSVPFLDILARIPAAKPPERTPLEKYALGIWNAHFWDKDKAYFDRHGDYTGLDPRTGEGGGFPAHLGAYFRVWAAAYLSSKDPDLKKELDRVFHKVLDMALSRTEKYGFYPFTFDPELKGKDPGKEVPGQSIRLAHHAVDVAEQLDQADPDVAAKLRKLAKLHLGPERYEQAVQRLRMYRKLGERSYLQAASDDGKKPEARVRDLSGPNVVPNVYANEIMRNIALWRQFKDKAYLDAAEAYAKAAYVMFCDDTCPLPKARAGTGPVLTTQGQPFGDFYFHGAKLMRAFALLGEALQ